MRHAETVREFKTARFTVRLEWGYEQSPDLSWDETGETQEKIASGEWTCCGFAVLVFCDGREVGSSYLGNSVYADPADFAKEHIGLAAKSRRDGCNYGCYFTGMVQEAIAEARKTLCTTPRVRCA